VVPIYQTTSYHIPMGCLIFIFTAKKTSCYIKQNHTYLLTPQSRVFLEKLTGSAASQEIPHIFGTWRFITILTSARHLSLSWANSIQSPQPPPTSWRSILMLSSHLHLGLSSGLFPSGFPTTRTLCTPPHTRHMPRPSHSSRLKQNYFRHNLYFTLWQLLSPFFTWNTVI